MAKLAANEQVCISTDLNNNMLESFIDIHWLQENFPYVAFMVPQQGIFVFP